MNLTPFFHDRHFIPPTAAARFRLFRFHWNSRLEFRSGNDLETSSGRCRRVCGDPEESIQADLDVVGPETDAPGI